LKVSRYMVEINEEDDFVAVPVPQRHVVDVYRFLADIEQKSSTISPTEMIGENNWKQWWEAHGRIARLKQSVTNKTVLSFLNLVARSPGKWFSFADVCREAGCDTNQGRADLRGLSIMIREKLFPGINPGDWWPVDFRHNPMQYCMPEEIARQWNEWKRPA
jgi:hypothetical protein